MQTIVVDWQATRRELVYLCSKKPWQGRWRIRFGWWKMKGL